MLPAPLQQQTCSLCPVRAAPAPSRGSAFQTDASAATARLLGRGAGIKATCCHWDKGWLRLPSKCFCPSELQERDKVSPGAALTLLRPGRAPAAGIREGREEAMGSPLYCCHLFLARGLLVQCCCRGVGKAQPCAFTGVRQLTRLCPA